MGLDLGIACGVRESWLGIHPIAWVFSSQWWVGDLLDRPAALTGSVGFQPPQLCQQPKDVAACFEAENNQLTSPHTFHFNYTCSSYSVLKNKKILQYSLSWWKGLFPGLKLVFVYEHVAKWRSHEFGSTMNGWTWTLTPTNELSIYVTQYPMVSSSLQNCWLVLGISRASVVQNLSVSFSLFLPTRKWIHMLGVWC